MKELQTPRNGTADLLKGIAVLLMIQVHFMEQLATPDLYNSTLGKISLFLGGPACAPAFMAVMGYFLACSKKNSGSLVRRGLMLFAGGMLLNILRSASLLVQIITGRSTLDPWRFILGADILGLAGLSILAIAILRPLFKRNSIPWAAAAVVVAGVPALFSTGPAQGGVVSYFAAFITGGAGWSYFPLFPWLAYVLSGYAFGLLLNNSGWPGKIDLKNRYYFAIPFWILIILTIPWASGITSDLQGPGGYYHHSLLFFAWTIIFLLSYLVLAWLTDHHYGGNSLVAGISWLGRKVTALYVIQWLIIGNLAAFFFRSLNLLQLSVSLLGVTAASILLTLSYDKAFKAFGRRKGVLLLTFILCLPLSISANTGDHQKQSPSNFDYEIAIWPGFKKAALSITFDDNYRFQFSYALPLLNQHLYKATYFVVTNRVGGGWAPGWDTISMAAIQGHEIASHSKNHADFTVLGSNPLYADSMKSEFRGSRDTINARVRSQKCETFAWPNGSVTSNVIEVAKQYYNACRGSVNQFEGQVPNDYFNIRSQHIYHDTQLDTVNAFVDTIVKYEGWLVERWHGFRVMHDTNGYEPVPIGLFDAHLNHIASKENRLWIATLSNVAKYTKERQASVLSLADSSGMEVKLSLINGIPDTLCQHKVPLSLKVRMYGKMQGVYLVTQGSDTLPYRVANEYGFLYLYFDAVPNNGLIILHTAAAGSGRMPGSAFTARAYPNPFSEKTSIVFELAGEQHVSIRIFDAPGRLVKDCSGRFHAGSNTVCFDAAGLAAGIYFCIISSTEGTNRLKLLPGQ